MTSLFMNNQAGPTDGMMNLGRRGWMQVGSSLMAGLGIGAIAMYLLDPQAGQRRRQELSALAGQAGEQISDLGSGLSESAGNAKETLGTLVSGASRFASRKISNSSIGSGLAARAAKSLRVDQPTTPIGTIIVTAVGCAALGAGLMFIFDPIAGRRRRAIVRNKTYGATHQATKKLAGKGKHYENVARGVYHDVTRAVKEATRQDQNNPKMDWTTNPKEITDPR